MINHFVPCSCEHTRHFDDEDGPRTAHEYLAVPAGTKAALFVGLICDTCATECLADYLCRNSDEEDSAGALRLPDNMAEIS